jgi:hypothetical protein
MTARILHWVMAILILSIIPLGLAIANDWGGLRAAACGADRRVDGHIRLLRADHGVRLARVAAKSGRRTACSPSNCSGYTA